MQIPLVFYPDSFYFTVTLMDAFLLLYVFTVIVAVPFLNAVTLPFWLTLAIFLLEEE